MRATWSEPYLWVHLAGLAAVPIFLELCLFGLAASTADLPAPLVLLLVAAAGIVPIAWMQWQRPFSIFSLLLLAVKPKDLNELQRQVLQRFTAPIGKVVTVLIAGLAMVLLWQLDRWVPLVSSTKVALVPGGPLGGLLLAMSAFLLTNLFLQVPASVLTVMLTPDVLVRNAFPYPVEKIAQDFTLIGVPVQQILPRMVTETVRPAPANQPVPQTQARSNDWDEALTFEQDQTTGQIDAVGVDETETMADSVLSAVESVAVNGAAEVAEAEADRVASAAEREHPISLDADENESDGIEPSADSLEPSADQAADRAATDQMATEFTEVEPGEPDASEAAWTNSTPDPAEALKIAPETANQAEPINPFAIELTEAEWTEPVEPVQSEQAEGELLEPIAAEPVPLDATTKDSQPVPDHSAENGRSGLGGEMIAAVALLHDETLADSSDSALSGLTVVRPDAADTVVTIVVTDSRQAASDQDSAEVTQPTPKNPALTVAETVVRIILS